MSLQEPADGTRGQFRPKTALEPSDAYSPYDVVSDAISYLMPERAISSRALLSTGTPYVDPNQRRGVWLGEGSPVTSEQNATGFYNDLLVTPPRTSDTPTGNSIHHASQFIKIMSVALCPSLYLLEAVQRERVEHLQHTSYYTDALYERNQGSNKVPQTYLSRLATFELSLDKERRVDAINSHMYRKMLAEQGKSKGANLTMAQRQEAEVLKNCTFKPEISEHARSKKLHDAKPRGALNFFDDGLKWMKEKEKRLGKKIEKKNADQAELDEINFKHFEVDKKSYRLLERKERDLKEAEAAGVLVKGTVEAMKAWQKLYPHAKNRFPSAKEIQNVLADQLSEENDLDLDTLVAAEEKLFGNYFGYHVDPFIDGDDGDNEELLIEAINDDETLTSDKKQRLVKQIRLKAKRRKIKALERFVRQDKEIPYWAEQCSFHPEVNAKSTDMTAKVWASDGHGRKSMGSRFEGAQGPTYIDVISRMEDDIDHRRERVRQIELQKIEDEEKLKFLQLSPAVDGTAQAKYLRKLMTGRTTSDSLRVAEDQRAAAIKAQWLEDRMAQQRAKVVQEMLSKEAQLSFLLEAVEDPNCDLLELARSLPSATARKFGAGDPRNIIKSPTRGIKHDRSLPGHPANSYDSSYQDEADGLAALKAGLKPRIKSTPAQAAIPTYAAAIAPMPDEVAPADPNRIQSTTYSYRHQTPSFLKAQQALYDSTRFEPNTDQLNSYNGSAAEGANLVTAAAYRTTRNVKQREAKEAEIINDHLKLLRQERLSKTTQQSQLARLKGYADRKEQVLERKRQEDVDREGQICTFSPYVSSASRAMVARHEANVASFVQQQHQYLASESNNNQMIARGTNTKSPMRTSRAVNQSSPSLRGPQSYSTPVRHGQSGARSPMRATSPAALSPTERIAKQQASQQKRWDSPAARQRYQRESNQSQSATIQSFQDVKTEERRLKALTVIADGQSVIGKNSSPAAGKENSGADASPRVTPWPTVSAILSLSKTAQTALANPEMLVAQQNNELRANERGAQNPLDYNNHSNYGFKKSLAALAYGDEDMDVAVVPTAGYAHRVKDPDVRLYESAAADRVLSLGKEDKVRQAAPPVRKGDPTNSLLAADGRSFTSIDGRITGRRPESTFQIDDSPTVTDADLAAMDDEISQLIDSVHVATTPSPQKGHTNSNRGGVSTANNPGKENEGAGLIPKQGVLDDFTFPPRRKDSHQPASSQSTPSISHVDPSLLTDLRGWFGHLASLRLNQVPNSYGGLQQLLESADDHEAAASPSRRESSIIFSANATPTKGTLTVEGSHSTVALEVAYAALNVALATSVAATDGDHHRNESIDWRHQYSELPLASAVESFPARLSLIEFAMLFGKMYGV